jgi:hypothetical protein
MQELVVPVVGITGIIIINSIALLMGHNGALLRFGIIAIALLCGVSLSELLGD